MMQARWMLDRRRWPAAPTSSKSKRCFDYLLLQTFLLFSIIIRYHEFYSSDNFLACCRHVVPSGKMIRLAEARRATRNASFHRCNWNHLDNKLSSHFRFLQYINKAAGTMRSVLKEPAKTRAMAQEAYSYNASVWEAGKMGPKVPVGNIQQAGK